MSPDRTATVGRQLGSHVAAVAVVQADVDPRDHDRLRRKIGAAAHAALVRCFFRIVASTDEGGNGGHFTPSRRNCLKIQHVAVPGFSQYEMEQVDVDVVVRY